MDCLGYLFKLAQLLQYVEMGTKPLSKKCLCTIDLVFAKFIVLEII